MCDFDLSQALDSSPTLDEIGCESRCFNMKEVQNETEFRLDEGLDLVVSHNAMKCVANLLLAVNRMKKSPTRFDRELSGDELCCMIMDSLVDETIVRTTEHFSTGVKGGRFLRVNSLKLCTLCDTSHKDIVHGSGGLNLQAITLKGGHSERKVNFKLSRYIHPRIAAVEVQTVLLSITSSNLHISCSMKDGRAVLNLEEWSEEDLQTIRADGNMERFLFYKRTTGISLTTFESVKCCGWFISTSYEDDNQAVEMCEADAVRRLTSFKLH